MSKTKRKRYSVELEAKIALEAIKGEQSVAELASRHGLHPNPAMIANCKRQALANMAEVFTSKAERARDNDERQIKDQ